MSPADGSPASPVYEEQRSRAESAVPRAQTRARRAHAVRVALHLAVASSWTGTAALAATTGSPAWTALCGGPALLVTAVLVTTRAVERRWVTVSVSGTSMEPAYREGDGVLVRRRVAPARGAVVVVERPPYLAPWPDSPVAPNAPAHAIYARHWFIKRVAAVPGDPVPVTEVPALADTPAQRVPKGMLVLLGDNRGESYDSRSFGYFPVARVLGTVEEPERPAPSPRSRARTRNT